MARFMESCLREEGEQDRRSGPLRDHLPYFFSISRAKASASASDMFSISCKDLPVTCLTASALKRWGHCLTLHLAQPNELLKTAAMR